MVEKIINSLIDSQSRKKSPKKPIKIIFFHIMGANFSGAAKNIYRLLNRINPNLLTPILVGQRENELTNRVRRRGLDVFVIPFPAAINVYNKKLLNLNILDYFKVINGLWVYNIRLIRFFKVHKPDVIWADNIRTFMFLYLASKFCKCKVILNIMSETQGKMAWFLHRIALIMSDVVNLEYADQGNKIFGKICKITTFKRKIVTLYSGVTDFEKLKGSNIRNELNLSKNDILIFMASNIYPLKGQLDLIKAIEYLFKNKTKNIHLIIAGKCNKGDYTSEDYDRKLKDYIEQNKLNRIVHLVGWRTDIVDLFSAIDIYVSTSYSESFPDSVREAMKSGKPIIVTDVGGTCELVNKNLNGYLFKPGDIPSLIKYLDILVNDEKLRISMGIEGKKIIKTNFSTVAYTRKFEKMVIECSY